MQEISAAELRDLVNKGKANLVDTRSKESVENDGCYPGAIVVENADEFMTALEMNEYTFEETYGRRKPSKHDYLVCVDNDYGENAEETARVAIDAGFCKVRIFRGDLDEFNDCLSAPCGDPCSFVSTSMRATAGGNGNGCNKCNGNGCDKCKKKKKKKKCKKEEKNPCCDCIDGQDESECPKDDCQIDYEALACECKKLSKKHKKEKDKERKQKKKNGEKSGDECCKPQKKDECKDDCKQPKLDCNPCCKPKKEECAPQASSCEEDSDDDECC